MKLSEIPIKRLKPKIKKKKVCVYLLAALRLGRCARAVSTRRAGRLSARAARASRRGGSCLVQQGPRGPWASAVWLAGSRALGQWLWFTGLAASWPVGPSWTREQTHSLCVGRRALYHESPGEPRTNYKFRLRKKKSPLLPGPITARPASAFAPALSLRWVYLGSCSPLLLVSRPLKGWGVTHHESL